MRDACRVGVRHNPRRAARRAVELLDPIHAGECWIARRPQMLPDVVAVQLKTTCVSGHANVRADVRARTQNGRLGADRPPCAKGPHTLARSGFTFALV